MGALELKGFVTTVAEDLFGQKAHTKRQQQPPTGLLGCLYTKKGRDTATPIPPLHTCVKIMEITTLVLHTLENHTDTFGPRLISCICLHHRQGPWRLRIVSPFINPTPAPVFHRFPKPHRQNTLSQLQFSSSILPPLRAGSLAHEANNEVSLKKSQITAKHSLGLENHKDVSS